VFQNAEFQDVTVMRKVRRTVKGELNRLIDSLVHPYFRECPALIVVDGLLHAMVEQDPNVSLRKFVRYGVPELLRCLARKRK
jgi:hypothetical protein